MKTEKIAVYALSAVLFSLMMLAYQLTKTSEWVPTYSIMIDNLLILLLARAGGNLALIIFNNKMSAATAAGIMAIAIFPLLLIRSEALFILTLVGLAPVTTFLIVYSWFQKRSRSSSMNFVRILAAAILAPVLNLLVLFMTAKNVPNMTGGEYGGFMWLVLNIGFGCIESIVLIIVQNKSYALQKNGAHPNDATLPKPGFNH
jgi:hypothetical protein